MAQNTFVVSGKGFFKGSSFDKETKTTTQLWTNKLREAKRFTSSHAEKFIENHSEEPMFSYRPWEEERREKRYKVVFCGGWNEPKTWQVQPNYEPKNDRNFLNTNGEKPEDTYSFEDATELARAKNQEIINHLQKHI